MVRYKDGKGLLWTKPPGQERGNVQVERRNGEQEKEGREGGSSGIKYRSRFSRQIPGVEVLDSSRRDDGLSSTVEQSRLGSPSRMSLNQGNSLISFSFLSDFLPESWSTTYCFLLTLGLSVRFPSILIIIGFQAPWDAGSTSSLSCTYSTLVDQVRGWTRTQRGSSWIFRGRDSILVSGMPD